MRTHKEYLDKQLSDKKFADRFYREKKELKMNKEYAEKVNAMTDEELQIKVAELLGMSNIKVGGMAIVGIQSNGEMRCIPDYPNDISAAWELVEEAIARGLLPVFSWWEDRCEVSFARYGSMRDESMVFIWALDNSGRTVQRAITKAFILAMEAND